MQKKRPSFQDYLDELSRGEAYGIFIDDTGSPGIKDAPENFHPERKTWVAIIVPPSQMAEVMEQMPGALDELKRHTGATEFHFTDIYSGRKQFKHVDFQLRLSFFRFMAEIFSIYKFPIFVQTFDPDTLEHLRARSDPKLPDSIPHFDFTSCGDLALFFLLLQLKEYMQATPSFPKVKARVFIDEGFKKNGTGLRMAVFDGVFADSQICFAQSSSIFPIQLADFAAFCLNRLQLIGGKQTRNLLDNELLKILSPVAFNYANIEKKTVAIDHPGPLITLADTRPHGPFPTGTCSGSE
jgi:hypothetical protein